ncbi:MAG: hypothetical protein H6Q02_1766, partial [Acidobacteria bacterium]|nr:hypothetical protein [Acidobacteriota bacterium]
AQCTACGNDDPAAFMTEEELEEFSEPAGGAEPE